MVLQSFFDAQAQLSHSLSLSSLPPVAVLALVVVPVVFVLLALRAKSHPQKSNGEGSYRKVHPLPTTLPILGNLLDLIKNKHRRLDWITETCEKHQGEPTSFSMLGQPDAFMVYTVQSVQDVLKNQFEVLPKGATQREIFQDLLGHGIFAVDGAQWVHQRKTASNLFTARALRDTMTESMRRYAVVLQRILQNHEQEGSTVDVFKLMNKFTIEAFAKMGFGIDMNCLEADEEHPFQNAFDSAQRVLVGRFQRPRFFWRLQRLFNMGEEAELKQNIKVIDATVMKIIAESLARRAQQPPRSAATEGEEGKSGSGSGDIVSLFLDRFSESNGEAFDPKYLRDIVVNFLIAGRDTTAQAMSWFFYNLSLKPEIADKIRQEIKQHLPELVNGTISSPSMEQVQQLVYLEAALKETLRLHPSVPLIPKSVTEDTVLSDGTFLPKDSMVIIPVYAMGRMTFIWGPDAKEFKPERWIDRETGKLIQVSPFQFVSFNAGPRMCLGMNLAMLEMKIVIASVLSRFDIELLDSDTVTYDNSLTLPVRGAMQARVTKARW